MIANIPHAPLLGRNTFGIDATARELIEYDSVDDLRSLAPMREPFIHIGGGSNLLFAGDCGTTLLHSRIFGVDVIDDRGDYVTVRAGAAVVRLCRLGCGIAARGCGESFAHTRRDRQCGRAEYRGIWLGSEGCDR